MGLRVRTNEVGSGMVTVPRPDDYAPFHCCVATAAGKARSAQDARCRSGLTSVRRVMLTSIGRASKAFAMNRHGGHTGRGDDKAQPMALITISRLLRDGSRTIQ